MSSPTSSPSTARTAILSLEETLGLPRRAEPLTAGVPLPRGEVRDPSELSLWGPGGELPLQVEALECWPDGSIRWALVDTCVDLAAREARELELSWDRPREASFDPIRVQPASSGWFVDTGAAQFTLERETLLRSVRVGGVEVLAPERSGVVLIDDAGMEWTSEIVDLALETEGPLRTRVRATGRLARPGAEPIAELTMRLDFHAGRASVRAHVGILNPRAARHPGGHWELGDDGSILFRELTWKLTPVRSSSCSWSAETGAPLAPAPSTVVEIYQDSSGGENWRSRNHVTREGDVPTTFQGYRVRFADESEERRGNASHPPRRAGGWRERRGRLDSEVLAELSQVDRGRGGHAAHRALPRPVRGPSRAAGRGAQDARALGPFRSGGDLVRCRRPARPPPPAPDPRDVRELGRASLRRAAGGGRGPDVPAARRPGAGGKRHVRAETGEAATSTAGDTSGRPGPITRPSTTRGLTPSSRTTTTSTTWCTRPSCSSRAPATCAGTG